MNSAAHDRSPDALARVAAGIVVPAVAVAAHGVGAGTVPSAAGVLLTAFIGGLVALAVGEQRRRSAWAATVRMAVVLAAAQAAAHVAMTVAHGPMAMHHDAILPMTLTHVIAIPLSAVLIVAATGLLAALTSSIRRWVPPRPVMALPVIAARWVAPHVRTGVVVGGGGVRGPPVSD